VFDLLGKKVIEMNDNFETTYNAKLDLSGFAIGQYMLRVALGDELVTRKLILLK
jgi:type IX secretion system substrate protein